ncbi:hypothetical protein HY375_00140 [Candidatus Berkelbacteria bacterium]|nr:hypothetical protein [Candidatus Berkelbacteria bacterium]
MKRAIPLTVGNQHADGVQKHTIERTVQLGPVSLRILTIASVASLALFYVAQTTQSATKAYAVQALDQTRQELQEDVERLELEAERLQSLPAIQDGLGESLEKDFEPTGDLKTVD